MRKNPTPGSIALIAASIVALVVGLTAYLFNGPTLEVLILFSLSFVMGLGTFYFLLDRFIYRKIKVIYKTIHQQKRHKYSVPGRMNHMKGDPISEVRDEVMSLANDNIAEIEELKKQESYRREFLGNVSHELKTPIFNIQGYIHTLLDGALTDVNVNEKFLLKASRNVERLVELVEDLTAISQLESGELKMKMHRFDMHVLAREVYESVELKAKSKNIFLGFKEGCNGSFYVKADKQKIRQVFTNLIVNSLKYGKENGHVLAGFYDMDKYLLTEISDNGEGIEEMHLPRLFERFYRIDKSRSREAGGSGLGLAIVKHIIEAHRQTINVRSALGVGTTFGFTLENG